LQIRIVGKSTGLGRDIRLTFNGVSTATHSSHYLVGNSSVVGVLAQSNQAYIRLYGHTSASTTANAFSASIVDILDYTSTNKNKTIRSISGQVDSATNIYLNSGQAPSSAAITSLSLVVNTSGDFYTTSSRFSLYGIKG